MTPVTPMKPGPTGAGASELRFYSNNIQFIETPARNADAGDGASLPEVQGARAEMWNESFRLYMVLLSTWMKRGLVR